MQEDVNHTTGRLAGFFQCNHVSVCLLACLINVDALLVADQRSVFYCPTSSIAIGHGAFGLQRTLDTPLGYHPPHLCP